jgi:hypothetical protein
VVVEVVFKHGCDCILEVLESSISEQAQESPTQTALHPLSVNTSAATALGLWFQGKGKEELCVVVHSVPFAGFENNRRMENR